MARCRETAGFLFAHPCSNSSTASCVECSKPICEQHKRIAANGTAMCLGCYKKSVSREQWREDPMLYSSYHYHDYDDLSEFDRYSLGDRASFDAAEGAAWTEDWGNDWEDDYDGS